MRVIDFHTHCWPDRLAPLVAEAELRKVGQIGAFRIPGTSGALEAELDAISRDSAGTSTPFSCEYAVIQPVATSPRQVESCNRWASGFIGSRRIIPFAAVHPNMPEPAASIQRIADAGFKGIKLHPLLQGFHPQEPRMFPIYDAAISRGLIMLFHSGTGLDTPELPEWRSDFDEFFALYPYERTVLAHMGGNGRIHAAPTPMPGRPGYIDLAWVLSYSNVEDKDILAAIRAHGSKRVLFGSDSPWVTTRQSLERFMNLELTQEEREDILYNNAAQLLGL